MGQYYKAAVIQGDTFKAYELDGWKLLETAWMKNHDVAAIFGLLLRQPARVLWVGDYTDTFLQERIEEGAPEWTQDAGKVAMVQEAYQKIWNDRMKCEPARTALPLADTSKDYILVNNTKKQFVRWSTYKAACTDDKGWCIHPLPLLCATSNGLGGGDYRDGCADMCGSWCGDWLSACEETEEQITSLVERGFTESAARFIEVWD